jgi:hypothetical protein
MADVGGIGFKQFAKEPIKAILFILLLAVGYLYVDQKLFYNAQIEAQGIKIQKLESKIDQLTEQLRKSDSTYSAAASKIATLQQLGKIK